MSKIIEQINSDHQDLINVDEEVKTKTKKPSMYKVLMLNDDYEGGVFEFGGLAKGKCQITPIKAKAGDMIFFTSGMEHRVAPITKGVRYSLVGWFVGAPIR